MRTLLVILPEVCDGDTTITASFNNSSEVAYCSSSCFNTVKDERYDAVIYISNGNVPLNVSDLFNSLVKE